MHRSGGENCTLVGGGQDRRVSMAMGLGERIAAHRRETRALLRRYLEQGLSKTELAKRFGSSRRTVYHWIERARWSGTQSRVG